MNDQIKELELNPSPSGHVPQLANQTTRGSEVPDTEAHIKALLGLPAVEPWGQPVEGKDLLDELAQTLRSHVFLPKWAAETLALWVVHTYAFKLRDVTTYIGIESPEHRCGKSTLVTVLSELAHLAVVASNVSSPAFFRVIEQLQPALLIDEADTFLQGNDELRGILNSGYQRKTAYVLRAVNLPSQVSNANPGIEQGAGQTSPAGNCNTGLARYSCWCPKVIARIGRLPRTLADRCVVFRMQRKTAREACERLRNLKGATLRRQCARFVEDHAEAIASAQPQIPSELNDRAADIWEPLLALADLAGGEWPGLARQAAVRVSVAAQENNPTGSLLLDIHCVFVEAEVDRIFSQTLVEKLNGLGQRPWSELCNGKALTDRWLSRQLRPYGINPRNLRMNGMQAKGYLKEEMMDVFRRYISKSDFQALVAANEVVEAAAEAQPNPVGPVGPGTTGAEQSSPLGGRVEK